MCAWSCRCMNLCGRSIRSDHPSIQPPRPLPLLLHLCQSRLHLEWLDDLASNGFQCHCRWETEKEVHFDNRVHPPQKRKLSPKVHFRDTLLLQTHDVQSSEVPFLFSAHARSAGKRSFSLCTKQRFCSQDVQPRCALCFIQHTHDVQIRSAPLFFCTCTVSRFGCVFVDPDSVQTWCVCHF